MDSRVWLSGGHQSASRVAHASGPYSAQIQGLDCTLDLELRPDGHLSGTLDLDGETLWLVGGIAGYSSQGYGFLLEPSSCSVIVIFVVRLEGRQLTLEVDVPDFSERLTLSHTTHIVFERGGALEDTVMFGARKETV